MPNRPPDTTPVGYAALIDHFDLRVVPHFRSSYVAQRGVMRELQVDGILHVIYPSAYRPSGELGSQLEFALKHDGTNLEILRAVFEAADTSEIESYISSRPTGKYARRIWFFYEFLTGRELSIPDLKSGTFIDVLDSSKYYTARPVRVPRQRVNDNLLGNRSFCPMVRRNEVLARQEDLHLDEKAEEVLRAYDPETVSKAVSYLYTKETISSFEIERERPSPDRAERFSLMLKKAPYTDELSHSTLIEVRNLIVEPRYANDSYRKEEVYVGEFLTHYHQKVHFIGAPQESVRDLMDGLVACYHRMRQSDVHPVIAAAAISFGFVFIHPFEDGNGRTHRFLIHYILAKGGFTPDGVIFPVSSTMVRNLKDYDECLESFSKPLMPLIDYDLDEDGRLTVNYAPVNAYRYYDATRMAQYLFFCIQQTILLDFKNELDFIVAFRTAKERIQEIVDMPDRKMDLFIKLCLQNKGRISQQKAEKHFPELSESELEQLAQAVKESIGSAALAYEPQH